MSEPTLFSAVVTPHRSLGRGGLRLVMLLLGGAGGTLGLLFLLRGAWPVTGFLGLDVVLVYCALRVSDRTAQAREHIVVTSTTLRVRRFEPSGAVGEWSLHPAWVRLDREIDPDFGTRRLALVAHGRSLTVAHWLSPAERDAFADALGAALAAARCGQTRSDTR